MMRALRSLLHFEWLRLARSPMRAVAIGMFFVCGLYAIGSGVHHVSKWGTTLAELREREQSQRTLALQWLRSGTTGPADRSYIDVTTPTWADRYATTHAAMVPEPLAALAIGLSDLRSSWAPISATRGAAPFESEDPASLGNAEKLLAGNFDLLFVFAYLAPLLLLVLLFDVGSLERDLGMLRLVRVQVRSQGAWLFQRIMLPVLVVLALQVLLCLIGGAWSGALTASFTRWMTFTGLVLAYSIMWSTLYGIAIVAGTSVSTAALWMVGLWLGFCVLVPAAVRQVVGQQHPSHYASELTTALRAERYEILLSDIRRYEAAFYRSRPRLPKPGDSPWGWMPAPDRSRSNMERFIRQAAFLAVVKNVRSKQARDEVAREAAVARFGWLNPAHVFQRALCVLAGTESLNYREHRKDVLAGVSARLETLVDVGWHAKKIDQAKFESLFEHGPYRSYGRPPEAWTHVKLLGLLVAAVAVACLLAGRRSVRQRRTGAV